MNGPEKPADKPPQPPAASGAPLPMMLLVFAFGTAAGVLLAFFGAGFFGDGVSALVLVFLVALLVLGGGGLLVFLFRRPILRSLFGYAEAQVELFADPLARVAQRAIARDPDGATSAARELVGLTLARYSWITTRRWIVASLTALIAAMAALAGTALLFKQNELLAAQSALLVEQNTKIQEQTALLSQEVELAEASRNAALAVEITNIAARLGAIAEEMQTRMTADLAAGTVSELDSLVNLLDPATDLDQELILRIVSLSKAVRPYRFLDMRLLPEDDNDKTRAAMLTRRADLPQTYDRMAAAYGWRELSGLAPLIDRPASPERGQLLSVLIGGGIRNLEILNHFGLDLSFAHLANAELSLITAQGGQLSYADFDGSYLTEADFGGAYLENLRCRRCRIERSTFAAVDAGRVRPPLRTADAPFSSFLIGADFSASVIIDTDFSGATMTATNLDGALLFGAKFTGAALPVSTLRGAVLIAADFSGADLYSTDLDGAVVFGADFLERLAAAAAEGSFVAGSYEMAPLSRDELMAIGIVNRTLDLAQIDSATGNAPAFRLTRTAEFKD